MCRLKTYSSFLLVVVFFPGEVPSFGTESPKRKDCGLACSYVAIASFKNDLPAYSDFRVKYLGTDPRGISALQIADICKDFGLHALVIQVPEVDVLPTLLNEYSVIVLLNNNHFVLVEQVSWKHVGVLDVPKPEVWTKEDFSRAWDGVTVVVSSSPIILPNTGSRVVAYVLSSIAIILVGLVTYWILHRSKLWGFAIVPLMFSGCEKIEPNAANLPTEEYAPRISLETAKSVGFSLGETGPLVSNVEALDLGKLAESSSEHEFIFYVRNESIVPVRVSGVKLSCACTDVVPTAEPIEPGKAGLCKITIRSGPNGRRGAGIQFQFDQPFPFERSLTLRWDSQALAEFVDSEVDLGVVEDETVLTKSLPLTVWDTSQVAHQRMLLRVDGSPAGITAKMSDDKMSAELEITPLYNGSHFRLILETTSGELLDVLLVQLQRENQRHFPVRRLMCMSMKSSEPKTFDMQCSEEVLSEAAQGLLTIAEAVAGDFSFAVEDSNLKITYNPPFVESSLSILDTIQLQSPTAGKVDCEIFFRIQPATK